MFKVIVSFSVIHRELFLGMMQTWGVWYDPVMTWAIPAAGTAYILRFLAPGNPNQTRRQSTFQTSPQK